MITQGTIGLARRDQLPDKAFVPRVAERNV